MKREVGMKSRQYCGALSAGLALVLVLLLGCTRAEPPEGEAESEHETHEEADHGHDEGEAIRLGKEAMRSISLETVAAGRQPVAEEVRSTAVVKPNDYRLAHVSPRISGKAIEVRALLGQKVSAGEVLAELDSLELGQRKADFLQARTNLDVGRRNYRREKRLFEQQISSEKEYLEAKGEFERSEAAYRSAREALRLVGLSDKEISRITWEGAKEPLSHFPLVAPFPGTIIERHITIGELIDAEDKPFTIADLASVWVLVDIYEADLGRVRVGDRARIVVDSYPQDAFEGEVTYLSEVVNPETRTAQARVEVPNPEQRLRPGMFARVAIRTSSRGSREALVVPRDAVQKVRGESVVFVADEKSGTFLPREVSLGQAFGDFVEVVSGLREGEPVVTKGAFYLKSSLLKEEMAGHEH
ncbi:MAG: efflux RND transporter periplasmic adaptor subunit [Candidatus Binatia bacterium]